MGSEEATFDEVFDELYPRARTLAWRILGDLPAAEDAAAEAMTRALVRWNRVGSLPYRDGWILRVTANVALDVARRRTRASALRIDPLVVGSAEDELVVLRSALVEALLGLPKRQREAITYCYLEGMDRSSAARRMGVEVASVKTHLKRAFRALREDLPDQAEELR